MKKGELVLDLFQFQCGAIKGPESDQYPRVLFQVSIPMWCD